jgi:succinate-semialdehyde dehydrogenase/glutarate-semialdehyde dehydrogenase
LNVVTTKNAGAVVNELLSDDSVRMLSFTGSTEVGRLLLSRAANTVLKTSMELGGNAPFIVLDDANIEDAVAGAMIAKMRNGGQACTAANRFYVHREVHDEFVAGLVAQFERVRVGAGRFETTDCGPLINREAVDKVTALVEDAVQRGATVVAGGSRPEGPGHFYPPTVLTDVTSDAALCTEEIFGPVAAITRFDTDDEVVKAANETVHGLVSYLYTRDLARGLRLSERLEAGMIALNRGIVSDPAAPFGGVKQSGLGREGSHEGLLEYLEEKYVATVW